MRLHRSFAAFALAGPLVFGCAPSVTVDAPDIEVTQPNLFFPAAPVDAQGTMEATFLLSSNKLGAAGGPDAGAYKKIERLDLIRLAFAADTGIQDFSFLTHLTVTATNPDSLRIVACRNRPVVPILDYDVPPGTGAVLPIPLSPPVDLRSLWACPSLSVTVVATGTAPVVATGIPSQDRWSLDVVFSLSVRISQ
jgi:hypothetical protein